jgi:hypothetical protein
VGKILRICAGIFRYVGKIRTHVPKLFINRESSGYTGDDFKYLDPCAGKLVTQTEMVSAWAGCGQEKIIYFVAYLKK